MILRLLKFTSLSLIFVIVTSGCSSPQEEAAEYLKKGQELLEKGELVKAGLQFRNALQIDNGLVTAWYGLSQTEEKQGHLDKAYILLSKVVELSPTHVDAHIQLGKIYLSGNFIDKALIHSDKTLVLAPNNAKVLAFRAAVLLQLSDNKGAIREAKAALRKDHDNVDALIVLATERLSKGDAKSAISYLDKGIANNKNNIILLLIKIKALDSLGDHVQVIETFRYLISLYPEDKTFRNALAQYYIANNNVVQAGKVYKETVIHNPRDIDAKLNEIKFLLKKKGLNEAAAQLKLYIIEEPGNYKLQFALAELFMVHEKYKEAKDVYNKIINQKSTGVNAYRAKNKLAAIALTNNDTALARKLINEILKNEPTNIESLILKSTIELHEDNIDTAIIDLRTVLKNEPDSVKALILLARAHLQNHSSVLAKNNYQIAVEKEPLNQSTVLEYVNFLIENKELNPAEDVLNAFLVKVPDSIPALKTMAEIKLRKGDWESAYELAEKIKSSGGKAAVTDQILGAVYRGQKKNQQSIDAYKRAHNASPTSLQPIVALVRSYVRVGKYNEAHTFLRSVLAANPTNLSALVLLAQGHVHDKNYKQAEILLKRAIRTNSEQALGYLELSRLYTRLGKNTESLSVVNQGLVKMPSNISLKLTRARIMESKGQIKLAIEQYEKILKDNSRVTLAANNLASLLVDYDKNNAKSLKRALEVTQGFKKSANPYFRDTRGWVYYRMGQLDKATPIFIDAIKAVPEMPVFHYHLGMSLLAEGKKQMAKASLDKALALANNDLTGMNDIKEVLSGL